MGGRVAGELALVVPGGDDRAVRAPRRRRRERRRAPAPPEPRRARPASPPRASSRADAAGAMLEFGLAEGVGFEPTVGCPTHAFQACRFGRSRTPPESVRTASPARGDRVQAGYRTGSLAHTATCRSCGEVTTGSCATDARESGQDREVAAFSGIVGVPQTAWSSPQPAGGRSAGHVVRVTSCRTALPPRRSAAGQELGRSDLPRDLTEVGPVQRQSSTAPTGRRPRRLRSDGTAVPVPAGPPTCRRGWRHSARRARPTPRDAWDGVDLAVAREHRGDALLAPQPDSPGNPLAVSPTRPEVVGDRCRADPELRPPPASSWIVPLRRSSCTDPGAARTHWPGPCRA